MKNTTPSRYPSRTTEEKEQIYQIVDEGIFCTIAFIRESIPHQIPTGYCRVDDDLYIHGSSKSAFLDSIIGAQVSFSITHADALVLAPTAFDHSFNYRSVIGFAEAVEITDPTEKLEFFNQFTDRYIPGRIADVGEATPDQVSITRIIRLSLENAAAKVRTGDVNVKLKGDDAWCGVIPLEKRYGQPQKDEQLPQDLLLPDYISNLIHGPGTTKD